MSDALALLRHVGGLPANTPPGCPAIGEGYGQPLGAAGGPTLHGDVDCNWRVDGADALGVILSAGHIAAAGTIAC
jgi:hypothetical protein